MKISISIPDDLADAIEKERGDVPRSVWIRRAIEQRLEQEPRTEEIHDGA